MNGVQKDLTGMVFGKLTVLRIGEKRGDLLGIPWQTIYSRLRAGWPVGRALTTI